MTFLNQETMRKKIKNSIRVERAIKRVSQEEVAEGTDRSRQTIHAIETGKFEPRIGTALEIAAYFNKKVDDIFEIDENE